MQTGSTPTRSMASMPTRRWRAGAALAAVLLAAGMPRPAGAEGRYALVVGVEKYNPAYLNPLELAEDDMEAVGKALERLGFNVVTMTSAATIPERRPVTAADILTQVERRLKNREPSDMIVFAFSGHGVQLARDQAAGARETYFCPERARLDQPDTLLPMSKVLDRLRQCRARQKLLLVDACRVDAEPRTVRDKSGTPTVDLDAAAPFRRQLPEGMAALFSCGPRQKSFELPQVGGVFTRHVVDYLEGRADDSRYWRGQATVQELATYVSRRTIDDVATKLDTDQEPELVVPEGRFTDWPLGVIERLAGLDRKPGMKRLPPAEAAGPKAGDVVANSLGMNLVVIPAGEFSMGSDDTKERLRRDITAAGIEFFEDFDTDDERPVHRVAITKPFLLGQTEVTLGEFLAFYNDGFKGRLDCEKDGKGGVGYDPAEVEDPFQQKPVYRPWSWGHPDMDLTTEAGKQKAFRYPVVNVSWNDAVAFCEWLSKKEGKRYRLPTEAEWEYACRGGTQSRYWFGEDFEKLAETDNVGDQTAKDRFKDACRYHIKSRDGFAFTSPVGAIRKPNPFGLFDMHGNVAEWCSDWYDKASYGQSPAADPKGPDGPSSAGSFRVLRGGSWSYGPIYCRSASRGLVTPALRDGSLGFRVVCEFE